MSALDRLTADQARRFRETVGDEVANLSRTEDWRPEGRGVLLEELIDRLARDLPEFNRPTA